MVEKAQARTDRGRSRAVRAAIMPSAQAVKKLTPQDRIEDQELTNGYTYKIDNCTNSAATTTRTCTPTMLRSVSRRSGAVAIKVWFTGREAARASRR